MPLIVPNRKSYLPAQCLHMNKACCYFCTLFFLGKNTKREREEINILVGDILVKQLDDGADRMNFTSVAPLPENALLTDDGVLTYIPTKPENVALIIAGKNSCGFRVLKEFNIRVSPCLCKNGGLCQRYTNFTLGTGKLGSD